jgi:hypothetical protein
MDLVLLIVLIIGCAVVWLHIYRKYRFGFWRILLHSVLVALVVTAVIIGIHLWLDVSPSPISKARYYVAISCMSFFPISVVIGIVKASRAVRSRL